MKMLFLLCRGALPMVRLLLVFLSVVSATRVWANFDPAPGEARPEKWQARWITAPDVDPRDYGVYHFRKHVALTAKPEKFVVHVSGDARYRFFVNGVSVAIGPGAGDLMHWNYDTIDLAPYLRAGDNVLAAVVWHFGPERPMSQISLQAGFLLQAGEGAPAEINTSESWKVLRNPAYSPLYGASERLRTYIVIGPGEDVRAEAMPWGWEQPDFDDRHWPNARSLVRAELHGVGTGIDWWLVPRTVPQPEETLQRLQSVRRASGVNVPENFVQGGAGFTVPAHGKATLLLDQGFNTNAYPKLKVTGGRGAKITLSYAEALVDAQRQKGNRNEVEGRTLVGFSDVYRPDGGRAREYSPLWYRTFRYVELEIETGDEAVTIDDFHGVFTGYPFEEKGNFRSDDAELAKIWDIGWHTARLCAFETYMDCPYYEQLQYVGDTRIQALISLYVSGDDRLMRQAIEHYDNSRIAEGLTQSRYPSRQPQIINTFSLFWIDMVHDYWMHRDDRAFVGRRLVGVSGVLDWFERRIDPRTGMLGGLPYWTFVDWPAEWAWNDDIGAGGEPPGAGTGGSSVASLQLAITLRRAAELFDAYDKPEVAKRYRERAAALCEAVRARCWNASRQLFADTPEQKTFSQHANIFAVLAGAVTGDEARDLIQRVEADKSLTQATYYFRFYLHRAMKHAGLGDEYVRLLEPWRDMIKLGLTTFAERQDPTRSDCHAWSSSPNYELLATVCGIEPDSPGFKTVRVEPHFGPLTQIEGTIPHPAGLLTVKLERAGDRVRGTVTLPQGVSGRFLWRGRELALPSGQQTIDL